MTPCSRRRGLESVLKLVTRTPEIRHGSRRRESKERDGTQYPRPRADTHTVTPSRLEGDSSGGMRGKRQGGGIPPASSFQIKTRKKKRQSARPRRAPDEGHGPSNPGLVGGLTRSPRQDAHTCPDTPGVATSRNGHGRRAGRRRRAPTAGTRIGARRQRTTSGRRTRRPRCVPLGPRRGPKPA